MTMLVGVLHRRADLEEELDASPRPSSRSRQWRSTAPLDQVHDQERTAVVGDAAIEQAGDPGMLQPGQDLALGEESPSWSPLARPTRSA